MRLLFWRIGNTLTTLLVDILIVGAAYGTALILRFEGVVPVTESIRFGSYVAPVAALYLFSNAIFGMYRQLWRYASAQEVVIIGMATALPTALIIVVELAFFMPRIIPLSVVIMGGVLAGIGITISRYRTRLATGIGGRFERLLGASSSRQRVLIVGAGEAGQMVARHLSQPEVRPLYELVGYIDDASDKIGRRVLGGRVLGSRENIRELAEERAVDLIIIAIHRISGEAMRDIISRCEYTEARLKVLPRPMVDLGRPGMSIALRDVEPEDLMGRAEASLNYKACQKLIEGRRVLVTGAAGSIGSEICRQLVAFLPEQLIMLDTNESGLYDLKNEILALVQANLLLVLSDVTDKERLSRQFARLKPHILFHAAAYKHVPILEDYPAEAVRVNVLGTRNILEASIESDVGQVVVVSTDKAVTPTSVMGATKQLTEQLVAAQPRDTGTQFAVVRFGNVINSRGSVVPLFVRQIENRERITITHPDVTRYFMSIPEAVSLVIEAATLSNSGANDLFVLDMGKPLRIEDLARKLVRMHGLRLEDIGIDYIGLRPGEKLHEALTSEHETTEPTSSDKVQRVVKTLLVSHSDVLAGIDELIGLAANDDNEKLLPKLKALTGLNTPSHEEIPHLSDHIQDKSNLSSTQHMQASA
jgi:FlaA1/EpsC-like NDP-sugar epimerase